MLSHCPVIHGVIHIAFIFCLWHCFESADDVHGNVSGIFPLKIMENKDKFHLIESVKKYPAIYNLNSPEYKDNNVKQLYWTKIAKEVGKPAALCKSNWETLRNSYKRCRREEKRNPGRSNASKKKKWQYLDVMSFIDESPLSLPSTVSNGTGHASDDSIVKITEIPQLNETAEVEFASEDGDRNAFQAFEMPSSTDEDDESFKPAFNRRGLSDNATLDVLLELAQKSQENSSQLARAAVQLSASFEAAVSSRFTDSRTLRAEDDEVSSFSRFVELRLRNLDSVMRNETMRQISIILFRDDVVQNLKSADESRNSSD